MLFLPFHRRRLRRTAGLTLVAWVLALLAGMVNACQIQPHGPGAHAVAVFTQGDATERGLHATPALHDEDGDHDGAGGPEGKSGTGKAACLKFCDEESSTVAKGETAQTDLPCMVMAASIDWQRAMPTSTAATWQAAERPIAQGPALFIRFLRLTI